MADTKDCIGMLLTVMLLLLVDCINTLCLHSMQVLCESNGVVDSQGVFHVDLPPNSILLLHMVHLDRSRCS